jgi:hypothetical protein
MSQQTQNGIADSELSQFVESKRGKLQAAGFLIAPAGEKVELTRGALRIQFLAGNGQYRLAGWNEVSHVDESGRINAPVDETYHSFEKFEEAAGGLLTSVLES